MNVIKAWFALISASGTTNNVSKYKVHDYYRHSIFITNTSLNFTMAKLLKLASGVDNGRRVRSHPLSRRCIIF